MFMSPEQFVSSADCDQRSDLYSLAVTLYQAVSGGSLPFSPNFSPKTPQELHRYFSEVRSMHEHALPKPLASPLWPIIERCLSKRPEDRFANIAGFRSALEAVAHKHELAIPQRAKAAGNFWVLRDQGNSFMRLGNYEDAIKAFDAFLAVLPDESVVFNRALCLENLGHHAQALEVYKWSAERDEIRGLVNGSNCLRYLGRNDEALAYAQRAVELDATDVGCWISLGNAAFTLTRWQVAMGAYSTAHNLDRSAPTPAYNFGLAAERAGATQEAQQAYSAFLQLSLPDDSRRQYVERALQRISAAGGLNKRPFA